VRRGLALENAWPRSGGRRIVGRKTRRIVGVAAAPHPRGASVANDARN
jgi:hypothetical protein